MQVKTFKGGIHPRDMKEISMDQPIMTLDPGKEMVFLMSQHIGAPAKPLVKKGDPVKVGQMIAEAGGFVSSPVYSSVSGSVKALEKRRNAMGDPVDAIVIENDELDTECEYEPASLDALTKEDIIERIKKAGVVGMGGAGFPTHVKLSPKEPEKIDHILVNGSECEPYLTSDYRCLLENSEELVQGLACILKVFPQAEGVICIEDNKPLAIENMMKAVSGRERMRVQPLKTKYPEGAERSLIYAVTGREVNSSILPADAGCIVNNVDTVIAVYEAVIKGRPLMHRIFTVSGDAVVNARNYDVRIGMSYADIIEAAGGFRSQPEKLISGGPMMGFSL
ncbi:MAG: RnfABCDGE type electron transport complex subunit C, partial [Lachnospiraceae bacterium]|nr:RnfABCDGE type electron transport complex subunit C [Lachnospiraceae bacterium]